MSANVRNWRSGSGFVQYCVCDFECVPNLKYDFEFVQDLGYEFVFAPCLTQHLSALIPYCLLVLVFVVKVGIHQSFVVYWNNVGNEYFIHHRFFLCGRNNNYFYYYILLVRSEYLTFFQENYCIAYYNVKWVIIPWMLYSDLHIKLYSCLWKYSVLPPHYNII